MRQAHHYTYTLLFLSIALCGASLAQAPRTVRVVTTGHMGTPRSLAVAPNGPWRLIDLGDHRLVREGSTRMRWQFEVQRAGRVVARGEGDRFESEGFRVECATSQGLLAVGEGARARVYPGAFELTPVRSRLALRSLNEAPMEAYLAGVVSAEGSASFQPEALKALAIAARSYAERNRLRHAPDGELCDTVHCQVYPGVGRVPDKVARAVADTAGIVGLWGGDVIDAVYSADCGGRTRNSEDIWPGRNAVPYLRSVDDRPPAGGPDYCAVCRSHVWHLKLSSPQLGRLLGLRSSLTERLELHGIERDGSGRMTVLRVTTGSLASSNGIGRDDGPDEPLPCERFEVGVSPTAGPSTGIAEARAITLSQLRQNFGDLLRGRLVDAAPTRDGGLELEGRGLGHGVGLCQWGAEGMARPPYNHACEQILNHYYSGITLGAMPLRSARLSLQMQGEGGQPLAGASVQLLPGGPSGTTDGLGRWEVTSVPEGTYTIQAERGSERTTFYGIRVAAGKGMETRLALVWRERGDRVARIRSRSSGG